MYPSRISQGRGFYSTIPDRVSMAQHVRFTYNIWGGTWILHGIHRILEGVHRILDGVGKQGLGRILDEVCRILEWVARWLAPHTQQLQEDKDQTATLATLSWLSLADYAGRAVWEDRPAGCGGQGCGGQDGVAGRVGWGVRSGGGQGQVAGRGAGPAGRGGGGPDGWRGMNIWSKECSGVNIVS